MMDEPRELFPSRWTGPSSPRLLLVDDDEIMRRSSQRFLTRAGFDVVEAEGGAEALELVDRGERLDVAVIDLEMPEMDGLRLMRELRRRHPHLPMGLWTASDKLGQLTAEELEPAWFVISKLDSIGVLVQAICRAIYGTRASYGPGGGERPEHRNGSGNGNGGGNGHGARERVAPYEALTVPGACFAAAIASRALEPER
jgi:CheY-like chemotaxis protein